MSDTPRTDALLSGRAIHDMYCELADLARQLERELSEARMRIETLEESMLDDTSHDNL